MSSTETLADRLTMALDKRRMSARQAATKLGVSQAAVSRWLAGERQPDAAGLEALMAKLGISANWLLTGVGTPEPDRTPDAQYRAGHRDGLAEARLAIQEMESAHERAGRQVTPSDGDARTIAQAQAARADETPSASTPPRRRQKPG